MTALGSAPAEHEALRHAALRALREEESDAPELARRYALACARRFALPLPLHWPRRTAGRALRIVVLAGAPLARGIETTLAMISALPRERFEVAFAGIGAAFPSLPKGAASSLAVMAIPMNGGADDAKRLAALDPDVLIDLAGLDAEVGPLFAQRPARAIVTLADLGGRHVAPLVDDEVKAAALEDWLRERWRALPPADDVPRAPAMAALWTDAVRAHQRGDTPTARAQYAQVLELQPEYAPGHYLLGVVLRDSGDLAAARQSFTTAVAAAPAFVDARVAAAKTAQATGDVTGAIALCKDGLALTAAPLPLYRALGLALLAANDAPRAVEAFAAALALDGEDGETHYNHGVALQLLRHGEEASAAYQRALALRPDLVAAAFNLGTLHQELGATDAAIAAYERVLARDPVDAAAYKNLGEVLLAGGRIDAWLANFDRFEAHCPTAFPLAVQALEVLQHRGDFAALDRYLEGIAQGKFRPRTELELLDNLEQLLYLLLFFDVEPAVVFRYAQMYDRAAQNVYGGPLERQRMRRPGPLRIGYLSADLRNHVMGKMMWQALSRHDRSRFSLHFFSLSRERDEWTDRFAGIAESFVPLADFGDRDAALRIASDDLDLLVDLSTHTKGARPGILALKPARVLITHIASAGTVGLSSIDFNLTDRYADVEENQAFQIETLLPMDQCVYPLRRVAPASDHPFHRANLGIGADAILIGGFVTAQKLSRRCLGLWREVLARIPRAQLVFSPTNPSLRDAYVRIAAAGGIARERLCFVPQGRDDSSNQARYELIDFVLDTMPFGGVNGTLEALDMGVPVVTLVGKRHGERSAYSILASLGVTDTVAHTGEEYVEIACRLALDPAFMSGVRSAIRSRLVESPLADGKSYARSLERAYVAALGARAPDVLRDTA